MSVQANTGIIMGFKPPQIDNPMAIAARGEQLQAAQSQNALARAQLAAMPAKMQQEAMDREMEKKIAMQDAGLKLLKVTANVDEFNNRGRGIFGDQWVEMPQDTYNTIQERNAKNQQQQFFTSVDANGNPILAKKEEGAPVYVKPQAGLTPRPTDPLKQQLMQAQLDALKNKNNPKQSEEVKFEAMDAYSTINDLMMPESGIDDIFGTIAGRTPNITQKSVDVAARKDNLVSLLQLAARGKLKGQGSVSDTESKMLANAATILANPTISPDLARKELARAKAYFERSMRSNNPMAAPVVSVQLSPQDQQALEWANANPNDPRSASIRQRLGQ